ncbi:uncharacterized protein LOC133911107 [Phragmites australis]|uniref:uncharacterized protein LOC133911107 n=1 Tax=Phragmites australis TaxID=29695 RepID=UPI002D78AAAC|nr:uncharacterized protein LOC133911107 [Phragmites australis]
MLTMTIDDVDHLIGLPSKGEELFEAPKKNLPQRFSQYKSGTNISFISLTDYFNKNKTHDDNFIRRVVLYTIGVFICPTLQQHVASDYLNLVENVQDIRKLNWASLTRNHLISCIENFHKKTSPTNLKGNLALLQLWYWEKFCVHELDPTSFATGRDRPLIQYWTEERARIRGDITNIKGFGYGQIIHDIRKPIKPPKEPSTTEDPNTYQERCQNHQSDNDTQATNTNLYESLQEIKAFMKAVQMQFLRLDKKFDDRARENTQAIQSINKRFDAFMKGCQSESQREAAKSNNLQTSDALQNEEPGVKKNQPDGRKYKKIKTYTKDDVLQISESGPKKKQSAGINSTENKSETKQTRKRNEHTIHSTVSKRQRPRSGRESKPIRRKDDDFLYYGTKITKPTEPQKKILISKDYMCTEEDYPIFEYIKTSPQKKLLVDMNDALVNKTNMECLLYHHRYVNSDVVNAYVCCLRTTDHLGYREGGKVYIENAYITAMFKRDKNLDIKGEPIKHRQFIANLACCYQDHDMVFLPINIVNAHWYLAVINAPERQIHVLDSSGPGNRDDLTYVLQGLENYLTFQDDENISTQKWKDLRVTTWPLTEQIRIPMQKDVASCGLFMLKFMEHWTGTRLDHNFTQEEIKKFREQLPVLLVKSPLNVIDITKGNAPSSKSDAQEGDEDDGLSIDKPIPPTS